MRTRILIVFCCFSSAYIHSGCHNPATGNGSAGDQVDLDQQVTNQSRPRDTIFRNFQKNWKQFVNMQDDLQKAVDTSGPLQNWDPEIKVDCQYYAAAGGRIPLVQVHWLSPPANTPVRFDIALHYQGFQKNYYSTLFPVEKEKRFGLPLQSNYIRDSPAVLLTGPSLFPKVVDYQSAIDTSATRIGKTHIDGNTLLLTDVGPGLAYRIRMCTFAKGAWTPSHEILFSAPICPEDNH